MSTSYREGRKPHASAGMWQEPFLEELEYHGCIEVAARNAGVSPRCVYRHRVADEDFALDMMEALDYAKSSLEDECERRARDEYDENGKLVRRGSDILLIFRLKKLDHSYRDNWTPSKALDEGVAQLIADVFQEATFAAGLDADQQRSFAEVIEGRLRAMESATT